MEKLPLEILGSIFSSLPMVSQLQCREVCKSWRNLLPKPKMGLLHGVSHSNETETQFYFSEEKTDKVVDTLKLDHNLIMTSVVTTSFIVGSCNGLVCYPAHSTPSLAKVYICNPVTGEHFQLPSIQWFYSRMTIGFGYVRSTNEYKVVSVQCGFSFPDGKFQVYTFRGGGGGGGGRWRDKSQTIGKGFMPHFIGQPSAAVSTDGAIHWMDLDSVKPNPIAFNLENETFKLLPSIPFDARVATAANHVRLMELGGNLCVIQVVPSKRITIWELIRRRKIYWGRKFNLAWKDYSWFEPLGLSKRDKCLLYCNAILSCYDPETRSMIKLEETLKKFYDAKDIYTRSRLTPHVNSLVSLKELTEKRGGRKRKAPE